MYHCYAGNCNDKHQNMATSDLIFKTKYNKLKECTVYTFNK